ncbi:Transforming growth factor beta receptor type 3 [Liparis tanakae]|uniref:Transforming growth factor beta receptor type 3 n=1 Tax=Liparis tanakae TaxID=230148 RepID=A0A4Z2GW24_9TELE|nr:Transforming growth factor beta receptor type 3 [Liparis tanakae]
MEAVKSSNSVAPPYPPEPDLTLSSTLHSDPSTMPDFLVRARRSGYSEPTSSTEAELANGVEIQLAGAGADADAAATMNPAVARPPRSEERRPRRWLNAGDGARGGGRESFTVQCEDGRLSVSADRRVLQSSSVPVTAVTLRDSTCQAQANGSHFLLVFPVVSCGTEGLLLGPPKALQNKNTVLLWRDAPRAILALSETDRKSTSPLGLRFSGSAAAPTALPGFADVGVDAPPAWPVSRAPEGPGPDPGPRRFPTPGRTSAAVLLLLKLFATESYEQRRIGPCVVTADRRVYAESRFWTVVSEGCSSDPSLALRAKIKKEEEEGAGGDDKVEEETGGKEETDGLDRRGREAPERPENRNANVGAEEEIRPLRFNFILRPVYNNSIQFLHCSLRVCVSDPKKREEPTEEAKTDCQDRLRIPPLVSRSSRHQCEVRNIYRPMVVTHPIRSLAPATDQRTKSLSLPPLAGPDPEHSMPTGPVMGIVFAAFAMGVLVGAGLWGIHHYTGDQISFLLPLTHLSVRVSVAAVRLSVALQVHPALEAVLTAGAPEGPVAAVLAAVGDELPIALKPKGMRGMSVALGDLVDGTERALR